MRVSSGFVTTDGGAKEMRDSSGSEDGDSKNESLQLVVLFSLQFTCIMQLDKLEFGGESPQTIRDYRFAKSSSPARFGSWLQHKHVIASQ